MTALTPEAYQAIAEPLQRVLWPSVTPDDAGASPPPFLYALIDAAHDPSVFDGLVAHEGEAELQSLYQGQLAEDLADVAPYIAKLTPGRPFTDWLLRTGWGRDWLVLVHAHIGFEEIRRHFRKFTMVWTEAGVGLIFRFYDPCVLKLFLPTCEPAQLTTLFGPVARFIVEGDSPAAALRLECREETLVSLPVTLAPGMPLAPSEVIRP